MSWPTILPIFIVVLVPRQLIPILYCTFLASCFLGCRQQDRGTSISQAVASSNALSDQFLSLMNAGKNYLDQGDTTNALATYRKAAVIAPQSADLHLNMALAHLAVAPGEAIREAEEVLRVEPNSAAAYFIKGAAHLRLGQPEDAVKALENTRKIDPGETATLFQLGLARMGLKQWDEAITALREGIAMDPNRLHAGPHYLLAQSLLRAGRQAEAEKELELHQINLESGGGAINAATFERSKFTVPRVPFRLDQPEQEGIRVAFVDATQEVLGESARTFSGPLGVIDPNHDGWNSLFVTERGQGFRLLWNSNGVFRASAKVGSVASPGAFSKVLVGDLQNDRFEDVVVLGAQGSQVFRFETNGVAVDVSAASGLSGLGASDGLLMDIDFTGKLDLVAVGTSTKAVQIWRQFGPLSFADITRTSGVPASIRNARRLAMTDWNRDEHMDVVASRQGEAPLLLEKQRGGPLVARAPTNWIAGEVFAAGDFDNDLRPDLAVAAGGRMTVCFNSGERKDFIIGDTGNVREVMAIDYDNDGWLDLWTFGKGIRAWRNLGLAGFQEQSKALGLDSFNGGEVAELHFADFDKDCDSDVIVALAGGGLRYLRNEGGNANSQVKVQLFGNRSNASGLGCKVEIETGGLRLIRTVQSLPVEIGVGKYQKLDSFLVHWFNWPQGLAEAPFECKEPLLALELTIQEGSCPYLYAWDGERFRFVTDILGAAPVGLPVAEGRYIEADPEELVWIGSEQSFPLREGAYEIRITEELREVLYLDEAKLVVVDHAPGMEVHTTHKLRPGKPFPKGEFLTLHREHPLRRAERLDGAEVTTELGAVDGRRVSPPKLRGPQLRGLAEPHGLVLDFGPLDSGRPLVLVMNGWLRFGGGMANIAASHDPALPFPFPTLEAEISPGHWTPVDVTVGAPAGKTKTIIADLSGKLPPGARRLRLATAFEIHWDRIALLENAGEPGTRATFIAPGLAELRYRGFSALENLPPDWPLTPVYDAVNPNGYWTIVPGGWCTRNGDVLELIAARDEGLALINAGDELVLRFPVESLPPKSPGMTRQFFLYVDGWDKDSDFHVAAGTRVEPLPFHGMNDQLHGHENRPAFPSDALHRKYNTRWVEGRALKSVARSR